MFAFCKTFYRSNTTLVWSAIVSFFAGIIFWGAFNTLMEATNTLMFCTTCHEMESTVYPEYMETVHYKNRSGVRAVCSDCHVPHPWFYKIKRKIEASSEVYHKLMGTVDTVEKFDAHRLEMAKRQWAVMKSTDSRECRNCHSFEAMSQAAQKKSSWQMHQDAQKSGETCIDCHKGIAHKPVHKQLEAPPANQSFE